MALVSVRYYFSHAYPFRWRRLLRNTRPATIYSRELCACAHMMVYACYLMRMVFCTTIFSYLINFQCNGREFSAHGFRVLFSSFGNSNEQLWRAQIKPFSSSEGKYVDAMQRRIYWVNTHTHSGYRYTRLFVFLFLFHRVCWTTSIRVFK